MKYLPIGLLLFGLCASAAAQPGEPVAETQPAPGAVATAEDDDGPIVVEGEVPKDKRRVCETRVTTGSIMPKRVCRTVAQIEQDERVARQAIERTNRDRETRDAVQLINETGS